MEQLPDCAGQEQEGYGNFDRMAARALGEAKQTHPEISLWLLLPYHPAEQKVKAPEGFDGSLYPEGLEKAPRRVAIVRANRYVVDRVHFLIVYIRHPGSNTQKLFEYAKKKKLQSSLL